MRTTAVAARLAPKRSGRTSGSLPHVPSRARRPTIPADERALRQLAAGAGSSAPGLALQLQRCAGNTAVTGLISELRLPDARVPVQRRLAWTRNSLDQPGMGDIGGSYESYRNVLAALDRYHSVSEGAAADHPRTVPLLREVIHWCDHQLADHPGEARNAAVTQVRDAAYDEVARVLLLAVDRAHALYVGSPISFASGEAVLVAANKYLAEFSGTTDGPRVMAIRQAVLRDKVTHRLFLNTGYTEVHNLSAERSYHIKPRGAVSADINCALCTVAAVVTNVTGQLVTTDAVVRALHPNPTLAVPAAAALQSGQLDYARLYQHPETFNRRSIGRTLQGGTADASRINQTNLLAAAGIKEAVGLFGVSAQGGQPTSVKVGHAKQMMMSPRYDGCVFAVLVESAGHWNFARRGETGIEFIDYQSDRPDKQGPTGGVTPQLGITSTDLGGAQDVIFLAFGR